MREHLFGFCYRFRATTDPLCYRYTVSFHVSDCCELHFVMMAHFVFLVCNLLQLHFTAQPKTMLVLRLF